ncbi:EF-hand domain-containing protein [Sphingomonas lenta]|uniref:EF-hand domain-containing protein n=1 Tax=Sphingomonas lenta TaxID=1141887 RepID=A0A2A2SEC3_9SPHN|nr:EF-hand domain-containing protein [Sphingomonas lenta]PAX07588.1 hypothetical protein CKY28_08005 [Sphingomonas lenta]
MSVRYFIVPLALLAAPALAQETQASAAAKFSREFAQLDQNKDGVLTKDEVTQRMGRVRAQTKTGVQKIDPTHTKRLADLWFARADLNKNGKVTEAEAQTLFAAIFKRYDRNGDGVLGGERTAAGPTAPKAKAPEGR